MDFLFPKTCPICGRWDRLICKKCFEEMEIGSGICMGCGKRSESGWTHDKCKEKTVFEGMISLYDWSDLNVQKVIKSIKYEFNKELLEFIVLQHRFDLGVGFDGITCVPLTKYRENWRGFNQSEVIASIIGELTGIKSGRALTKVVNNGLQSEISDRNKRMNNVRGVYKMRGCVKIMGKNVILVDDVMTTGATMEACGRELQKAGAVKIWGVVLAHEMD